MPESKSEVARQVYAKKIIMYGDYSDDDSKIRWKSSVTGFDLGSKGNANLDAF